MVTERGFILDDGRPRCAEGTVPESWCGTDGIVKPLASVAAITNGAGRWFEFVDLGKVHREARKFGMFALDTHTVISQDFDLKVGDAYRVNSQLMGFDAKRLIHLQVLRRLNGDVPLVAMAFVAINVDTVARKVSAFPPEVLARLTEIYATHATLAPFWYVPGPIAPLVIPNS